MLASSALRLVRRFRPTRWLWRHRETVAEMVRGFLVTLAGVFLALYLTNNSQDRVSDIATLTRIRMTELEAQYAMKAGLDACSNAQSGGSGVFLMSFDLRAARSLAEDPHAPAMLPTHILSLLITYVAAGETLQRSIDVHRDFQVATGFSVTPMSDDLLSAIRSNAASLVAAASVVQERLAPYKVDYDRTAIRSAETRIREVREAVLSGKARLSENSAQP